MDKRIPQDAIFRLSIYLRALLYFKEKGEKIISSKKLAEFLKINHHQLRKDLSYFGHFGKKGVGYNCVLLIDKIKGILGLDRNWSAAVVGFGNLGKALSFYKGFREQGIFINVAFDIDKKKINKEYFGVKVYHINLMEKIIKKENIAIAIIAVPKDWAQTIVDRLSSCGIKAILNFAPTYLDVREDIILQHVDLSSQLAYLTYCLKSQEINNLKVSYKDNPVF